VTTAKPRVAVVFGGRSSEHAISCVSAGSVLRAIDRDAWDVVPVGITPEGRWVLAADDPDALAIHGSQLPEVDPAGASVVLAGDPTARDLVISEPGAPPQVFGRVDVVFPLLHGPYGEDGTLQGLLELAGVPYVGSGVLASAAAMDKAVMKVLLAGAGLPVGPYVVVPPMRRATKDAGDRARGQARATLQLPVYVKPARAGSSVGITKVTGWDGLDAAIDAAREHDPKVLIEQGLVGREIECGVLQDEAGALEASVCAEIRVVGGQPFYDFDAKYLSDATEFDVPAVIPAAVSEQVRALALAAFTALGCEGLARVDFFVTPDGVVVNEVNTIPGFTPVSMFPRMWAASGVPYPELVDRLLRAALGRPTGLR
jgi:D-alanine-D-alanine ligase